MLVPPRRLILALIASACLLAARPARADIVMGGTGNNTGPDPYGLSNYEGVLQEGGASYLATPIGGQYLVSATHINNVADTSFTIAGKEYSVEFVASSNDLGIWKIAPSSVNQHFDPLNIAPLYTAAGTETGKTLYDYGVGYSRGDALDGPTGLQQGWSWGNPQNSKTWGDGVVAGTQSDLLVWNFDKNLNDPNTSVLTNGDSGGGLFIKNNGVWELAGINSGVQAAYSQPNLSSRVYAALYNLDGYYVQTGNASNPFQLVTDGSPMESAATAISAHLGFLSEYVSVPEPSGFVLLGIGAGAAGLIARRRRARSA